MENGKKNVHVNQEGQLRPLASEATSQSKILGLAVESIVSHIQKSVGSVSTTYIVTPAKIHSKHQPSEKENSGSIRLTFGVNGSQVGVLEQRHKVSLSGFLKSHHSRGLEAQVGLHSKNVS
jgi:hypothetical protein